MKTSIQQEFKEYALNKVQEGTLTKENRDEWHHLLFNEDYYIIGYYQCTEWLKKHDLDSFEAIEVCQNYEREHFGELNKVYDNSEVTVNMYVYAIGYDWLFSEGGEDVILEMLEDTVKEELSELLTTLEETHRKINNIWLDHTGDEIDELLTGDYPYKSCFNELYYEVSAWVEGFKSSIIRIKLY